MARHRKVRYSSAQPALPFDSAPRPPGRDDRPFTAAAAVPSKVPHQPEPMVPPVSLDQPEPAVVSVSTDQPAAAVLSHSPRPPAAAIPMMSPNQVIGPYRIGALSGSGGMADVYKAWHTGLERHEAFKHLPPDRGHGPDFVQRFLREARIAARLNHPNIITIHNVSDKDDPCHYFTMEWMEGGDLANVLRCQRMPTSTEALSLLRQIAAAIDYAHSLKVIHRDLKPANILLRARASGQWLVKVADFGVAQARFGADDSRITKTGTLIGTAAYMSPEQAGSGDPVESRSDIYSLGVMAFELFCGRLPFPPRENASPNAAYLAHIKDPPPEPIILNPSLSRAQNDAILQALAKLPQERFDTCAEFVTGLSAR